MIAPSQNPDALAQIQVVNNNVMSNMVTAAVNPTTPGIYTNPSGGVYAAAVDANLGKIVTPSTPAQPGDTLEVFASGLGVVSPPNPGGDGAAPPNSPLSYTYNTIAADVDGTAAPVLFAGLAPSLAGLYQINVTIPATITAGDHFLDISGLDPNTQALESYSQQVLISVGSGAAAAADKPAVASARAGKRRLVASAPKRAMPCFRGAKPACAAR